MAEEKEERTPGPEEEEGQENATPAQGSTAGTPRRLVHLTRAVLAVALLFFIWYIFSDRYTPYTDQGQVGGVVVPVTPAVTGYLIESRVKLHDEVHAGDLLFLIDTVPYVLAVKRAEAEVDRVLQDLGVQSATVKAAASSVGVARAQLDRARRSYDRAQRIIRKNPGALSQADIDRVETNLSQAMERLAQTEANLIKAKKRLGPAGENNPQLRLALNALRDARMRLSWTHLYAPADGHIESYTLTEGIYCQPGQPLATLVSDEQVWIQANFKENNLSHMHPGNRVEFLLDVQPGRIFRGRVRSIGYGVNTGNVMTPGTLPQVSKTTAWLRDPQRFPVIIEITDTAALRWCRNGGQTDVVVYTGHYPLLDRIASWRIRINSWLSYVR